MMLQTYFSMVMVVSFVNQCVGFSDRRADAIQASTSLPGEWPATLPSQYVNDMGQLIIDVNNQRFDNGKSWIS